MIRSRLPRLHDREGAAGMWPLRTVLAVPSECGKLGHDCGQGASANHLSNNNLQARPHKD